MNKKLIVNLAAVGTAIALATSGASFASADPAPAPAATALTTPVVLPASYQAIVDAYLAKVTAYQATSTSYSTATSFKDAGVKFRATMKTWQELQKQNVTAKKAIAKLFEADVKAAKAAYDTAMAAATTDADKLAAENAKSAAIAAATANRKAAFQLITKVPAHPDQPKKSDYKVKPSAAPTAGATTGSSDKGKGKSDTKTKGKP